VLKSPLITVSLIAGNYQDNEIIGQVICPTEKDLEALKYALKHVEYIGMQVNRTEKATTHAPITN